MTQDRKNRSLSNMNKPFSVKASVQRGEHANGTHPEIVMGIKVMSKGKTRTHKCECGSKTFVKETKGCVACGKVAEAYIMDES